ncbi:MAG TPA: biotin--[acetyl-CoA-carboxylase] ligase [Thermoanaerobaculia bacterium]|nr:biotin--[acetyl-CoA-carboxylase] ligase [Thermoanaerobaculia bacterium]
MNGFPTFVAAVRQAALGACENLVVVRRVGSTNAVARRMAQAILEEDSDLGRTLVLAWEQSRGRGRRGNAWASPAGQGIYATLLEPLGTDRPLEPLPLAVAVGLADGVDRLLGAGVCRLKWPNDLLVEGRKLGGILIEVVEANEGRAAVIGFGINHAAPAEQPPAPNATTLGAWGSSVPDLAAVAARLVSTVIEELDAARSMAETVERYQQRSSLRPGSTLRCRVGEEPVEGTFLGFDPRGYLRLATPSGERILSAGEILE